jgi:hypothetical protein
MKNILYNITFAGVLFLVNSLCPYNSEVDFKKNQVDSSIDSCHSNTENLYFDVCLEDLFEDDSNESDRGKSSFDRIFNCNAYFNLNNYSDSKYIKILPAKPSFLRRTPLFIFIKVLRL